MGPGQQPGLVRFVLPNTMLIRKPLFFQCLSACLALFVTVGPHSTFAQSRNLRAERFIFDDGSGHLLTLQTNTLTGSSTLTFPATNAIGLLSNDGSGMLTWGLLDPLNISPGANNTFLVTDASGSVVWTGFAIDATLSGDGIGSELGIDLTHANVWTGTQTVRKPNIQTTLTDGLVVSNPTLADAAHAIQQSPSLTFKSNVWNTTSAASKSFDGRITFLDSSGTTPSGRFSWATNNNGSGYVEQMTLSSSGVLGVQSLVLGSPLNEIYGGTHQSSYASGDMLYASALNELSKIHIGAEGAVMQVVGGVPAWGSIDLANPATTSGVLSVAGGGTGFDASAAPYGSIPIGNGTGFTLAPISGTANQITITNGPGTIALSLPQNIAPSSTPSFGGLTLGGDLTFGGDANRSILVATPSTTSLPGSDLTLEAGTAGADADLNGGNLNISSGIARGNGSSVINFRAVAPNQGAGGTERSPATVATLAGDGTLAFAAGGDRALRVEQATAGHNGDRLLLTSGSGTASAGSSQNGGDIVLTAGAKTNAGLDGTIVMNAGGSEQASVTDSGLHVNTALTISGYLALQNGFITVPGNTINDDVDPGDQTITGIYETGTPGPLTITGFTKGTDGRELIIANLNTDDLTLGATRGSAVGNQIYTSNGMDLVMPPYSVVQLFWNTLANGWFVEFTSGINTVALGNTGLNSVTPNGILFGDGTNPVQVTAAESNSVLVTDGSAVPMLSQSLPIEVQNNISALTGISGDITFPTALTFNGASDRTISLARNTGTDPGRGLTIQAGAPAVSANVNDLNGGDLTLSSGVSEGTGLSSIFLQTPEESAIGNNDNTPLTRLTLNADQMELAAGVALIQNGTTRISSGGDGNFTSLTLGSPLTLANGGTNATLTASNGGIFYSTTSSAAILPGTIIANRVLLSGAEAAPAWSSATYPTSTTNNQLLYSSATNTIAGLASANDGILITSGAGVPSIASTLPSPVQGHITTLGTITSGVWQGTPIGPSYGGVGLDVSGVSDGQLLIGQTSDHTLGLATITAGTNVAVTNGGHSVAIGTVPNPRFASSVTTPAVFGGTADTAGLSLNSTSSGTPSGGSITMNAGGVEQARITDTGVTVNTALNVNGYFALQNGNTAVPGSATSDDVDPGNLSVVGIATYGAAGPDTITGFSKGTNGRQLIIANINTYDLTLAAMTRSAVGNQIITADGHDLNMPPYSTVQLYWNSQGNGWFVEFTSGINSVGLGNTGLNTVTPNGIVCGIL